MPSRFLAPALLLGVAVALPAQAPCRRPPARSFAPGSVVTLTEAKSFPCQVEFHDVGMELRPYSSAKALGTRQSVARDSKGRYFTSAGLGEISVWNADGTLFGKFGRPGTGPGEFKPGIVHIAVDPADNIFVRDNNVRWSVFSPEFGFLRSEPAGNMGVRPSHFTFVAPLMMLSSEFPGFDQDGKGFFGLFDFSGKAVAPVQADGPPVARVFGETSSSEREMGSGARLRLVNAPVSGKFWAGPPQATGRGYELQLWTLEGKVERTIRRVAPWFPPGSDLGQQHTEAEIHSDNPPIDKPPSAVVMARDNGQGLIYVVTRVTNKRWEAAVAEIRAAGDDFRKLDAIEETLFDIYIEVIDADAGVVLASSGPLSAAVAKNSMAHGWFGTGWSGYRVVADTNGLPVVKMMEVRLKGR